MQNLFNFIKFLDQNKADVIDVAVKDIQRYLNGKKIILNSNNIFLEEDLKHSINDDLLLNGYEVKKCDINEKIITLSRFSYQFDLSAIENYFNTYKTVNGIYHKANKFKKNSKEYDQYSKVAEISKKANDNVKSVIKFFANNFFHDYLTDKSNWLAQNGKSMHDYMWKRLYLKQGQDEGCSLSISFNEYGLNFGLNYNETFISNFGKNANKYKFLMNNLILDEIELTNNENFILEICDTDDETIKTFDKLKTNSDKAAFIRNIPEDKAPRLTCLCYKKFGDFSSNFAATRFVLINLLKIKKAYENIIAKYNDKQKIVVPEVGVNKWIYSPGEGARKWDTFFEQSIMGIGWSLVGDIRKYSNISELDEHTKNNDPKAGKTSSLVLWDFCNVMKIGDIVYVKKGNNDVIGKGIVVGDYEYSTDENLHYRHIRKVQWIAKGFSEHGGHGNPQNTLTNISYDIEFIQELEKAIENFENVQNVNNDALEYEKYTIENFLADAFVSENEYHQITDLLKYKLNIILQGPPGVGKTYLAKKIVYSLLGCMDENKIKMIQFHQSYTYEDFILGYKPAGDGTFKLEHGIFYNFCKKAENDPENKYFFIIDEINRGNLSKIFGELFMLLEKDKRGQKIPLAYKQIDSEEELFTIPSNLYMIGLMNTADRSLAFIDYALRRRFGFYCLKPAFNNANFINYMKSIGSTKLENLVGAIKDINDLISRDPNLGNGYLIGHSFLSNLSNTKDLDQQLNIVVEYEIMPLLREYWFDEESKIEDSKAKLRKAISE